MENNSTENNNHAVTSYQAVEYVFWHLRMDKFQIMTKISGKLKNADFIKKNSKIRHNNVENHYIVTTNHAMPYYQTLKETPLPLRMKNLKKRQKF